MTAVLLRTAIVGVLMVAKPGLGIRCYACVTRDCYYKDYQDYQYNCNKYRRPVCDLEGNRGVLIQCKDGISTCNEATFSDDPGVYRNCGHWDSEPGVHCTDGFCDGFCDWDACNVHLSARPTVPLEEEQVSSARTAGPLWWWLMAVPAAAAMVLTAVGAAVIRQRRLAEQRSAAAADPAWCEPRPPAAAAAAPRPPDGQLARLL